MQMAMQLAYYRLHGKVVLTYESATTRLYYHGRTETIRPVSDHSVAFVKAMDDPAVSREGVKAVLKKAIEYVREAGGREGGRGGGDKIILHALPGHFYIVRTLLYRI